MFPVFIVATSCTLVASSHVTVPSNNVASLGQKIHLDCSTDLDYPMTWWFTPYGSTRPVEFYFSKKVLNHYAKRYRVETHKKGHFTLVMDQVDENHAGRYSCHDNDGDDEVGRSAELTVVTGNQ